MSKVLVTGGSGFVGAHVILHLVSAGHQVRTTVRNLNRESTVREMLKAGGQEPGDELSFFAADLEKDAGWQEAIRAAISSCMWRRRSPQAPQSTRTS
jgi:dihydroflavonol-4-reductase